MFDITPDFVYPVFECDEDKNLYFQCEDDEDKLKNICFIQIKKDELDKITFLKDIKYNVEDTQRKITINSKPIFGFQISESEVRFGNYEYFKNFFYTFNSQNQILTNQILALVRRIFKIDLN